RPWLARKCSTRLLLNWFAWANVGRVSDIPLCNRCCPNNIPAHLAIRTDKRGVSTVMQSFSRFIFLLGLVVSVLGPNSVVAQTAAPKAYIGLFKDNALAVLDTASNKVVKTIPIPPGPHGLVVT